MPEINYIDIGENTDNVNMNLTATNNNNGSIYNSADLNVAQLLAYNPDAEINSLWELSVNSNPLDPNWNGYNSIAEMVADWPGVSIRGPPSSEVANKWQSSTQSDGSFFIDTSGLGPDTWFSTQQNPSQDMQAYTINIPKSQLELDGLAGYDPATDATIVLSGEGNTIADAFVGYQGAASFSAEGQYFQVQVPETSSFAAILGLGALGVVLASRKTKSLVDKLKK